MIFPPHQCFVYTALSLTGLSAIFFINNYFSNVSEFVLWTGPAAHGPDFTTIVFLFTTYAVILFTSTFLATAIMVRFRQRENDVRLLSRRLQESLTMMESLYEATKTMVSSHDMDTIFDIVVREATQIMKAKGAILRLVRQGEEELKDSAVFGLSERFFKKGPVKRNEGIFPRDPDDVIIVEDVATDPRVMYLSQQIEEGIKSIISVPLVCRGKVTGDLRLYSENVKVFSSDEISFLKILARGAATIIDNFRTWQKLEERNKNNIFLAHKMSHDLRAPVVAVQSLLSTMKEGYAGEISLKQGDILDRSIKKLDQLVVFIKDVLKLAESQISVRDHQKTAVCLDDVAGDTLNLLEVLFQKKLITLKYSRPSKPVIFQEVAGDFQRLFFNLLENALRYTLESGEVNVEISDSPESVRIVVRDTGICIEPEEISKIFNDFHRTKCAKQLIHDGTGLGLPTVKSIVKRYNGYINVESLPERGTAFIITLPKEKGTRVKSQ